MGGGWVTLYKCNSCGGVYSDTMADGMAYMHACPPLPPNDAGVVLERLNKRDENMQRDRNRRVVGIVSEGDGVTPVTKDAAPEPKWLTAFKRDLARAAPAEADDVGV